MTNIIEHLENLYIHIVEKTRDDGSTYKMLHDNCPGREFYQEIIRKLHDGRLPNDIDYEIIDSVVTELYNKDEDLEYEDFEINVNPNRQELFDWLGSDTTYFDDYVDEYGYNSDVSFYDNLMCSYHMYLDSVKFQLIEMIS